MFIINGSFLCRNLTGIERFTLQTSTYLDSLIQKDEIWMYVPKNAQDVPVYKNIKIVTSKKKLKSFPLWDHFTFSRFVKRQNGVSLDFANITPLFKPGFVFIHDIYAKLYPEDFITFKDRLRRFYMCWMYSHAAKKALKIFTVSEFSKKQIAEVYNVPLEKIFVIPNGWEHFKAVKADASIFKSFPLLQKKNYYFTLGSLQKRKNLKWILEYAKNNPDEQFAISGKAISGMESNELNQLNELPNVILLGYISDDSVKALMQNCKAFVFPSYYEGFGIPPLEALSVGARVIISNAASLPEIYKKSAYYIDPQNPNVSLSKLLLKPVEPADKILKEYTYKNAAKLLYEQLSQK